MLQEVVVIGGGRWARIITETLSGLLPQSTRLRVHSGHCADLMAQWAATDLRRSVEIDRTWPVLAQPRASAFIIVNSARDHERATLRALADGAKVLVEKPFALSASGAGRMIAAAAPGQLASALVLLFAEYLRNLARVVAALGKLESMRVRWSDATGESRYGETKKYDAGVPAFVDVLPHIVSVLDVVTGQSGPVTCEQVQILRGGACVQLQLAVGDVACDVTLERNSDRRRRCIDAVGSSGAASLDFSTEPGVIVSGGVSSDADTGWSGRGRPLKLMLQAFLDQAGGGAPDARLGVEQGLRTGVLIDAVRPLYAHAQLAWLGTAAKPTDHDPVALRYALSELLQADARLSDAALEQQISRLCELPASSFREQVAALPRITGRRA